MQRFQLLCAALEQASCHSLNDLLQVGLNLLQMMYIFVYIAVILLLNHYMSLVTSIYMLAKHVASLLLV
jgi:hypothetical protein